MRIPTNGIFFWRRASTWRYCFAVDFGPFCFWTFLDLCNFNISNLSGGQALRTRLPSLAVPLSVAQKVRCLGGQKDSTASPSAVSPRDYVGLILATTLSGTTLATGRTVGANGSGARTGLVAIRFSRPCVVGSGLILVVGTANGGSTPSRNCMYSRNDSPCMKYVAGHRKRLTTSPRMAAWRESLAQVFLRRTGQ